MRRMFAWSGLFSLMLALVVVVLLGRNRQAISPVLLANGRELRILEVTLGTNHIYSPESFWKQNLRRVLPNAWQKFLGPAKAQNILTWHESLVLWIEKASLSTGNLATPLSEQMEARLPDGSFAKGETHAPAGGMTDYVEFRCFDRKAKQIPLQYHDGANVVSFVVDNPRPTRTALWTAKPLPQTNQVSQTRFILSAASTYAYRGSGPSDCLRIRVSARTPDDGRTGWMYWRVTSFDSSGNWSAPLWSYSSRTPLELPMLPNQDPPWKLCLEAEEYISAGFLPSPTNGSYFVCTTDDRAQALGVLFFMVADRGSYFVTNGIVTRQNQHAPDAVHPPPSTTWSSRINWTMRLVVSAPGIVCLSDSGAGFPTIRARLRERLPDNEGRIFAARPSAATYFSLAPNLTLGLFPISLPSVTTNLEAEVIARHQPAEFFIEPPKQ